MHLPRPSSLPVLAAPALLLLLATPPLLAQQGVGGVVEGRGAQRVKIAVPAADLARGDAAAAEELIATLRDDLDFSGVFDVVDPSLYSLVPAAPHGAPRLGDWQSVGADFLIETRVTVSAERVDLDARLWDGGSGETVLYERYGGTRELLRRVAHQLADRLVLQFTGREGVALSRIAFVSQHGEGKEIYLMDYDGRRIRRLTTWDTINLSPVWSPDGEELAFMSWRGKQPGVYVMSSDGELGFLATIGGELSIAPDWSPDGRRIVYSSDIAGDSELYVLDRSSGTNTRLTRSPGIDTAPAFSPTGREIAFTSDRTGAPQIYVMDAEGLNVRRVTWEGSYNDSAAWAPDGQTLAYASRIDGRFEIVLLDLATDRTTRLTWREGNNENPRWSADGRHIVFASDRSGSYQIHTMRRDGSGVRRLTQGRASFTPDWSR